MECKFVAAVIKLIFLDYATCSFLSGFCSWESIKNVEQKKLL